LRANSECPCGSGKAYHQCCGRYIDANESVPTAETLMRSRYTAYTLANEKYLLKSWHKSTRPLTLDLDKDMPTQWQGLEILNTRAGGEDDATGTVEFVARFSVQNKPGQVHEISEFVREAGQWCYLDGEVPKAKPARSNKIGRNALCPCGSGKKFKRCCAP